MTKETVKAVKKDNVQLDDDGFDPLFGAERQAVGNLIGTLKNILEAIEARAKLISIVHNEESRNHKVFANVPDKLKKELFKGIYSMEMNQFVKLHKDLTKAEKSLSKVLKRFK